MFPLAAAMSLQAERATEVQQEAFKVNIISGRKKEFCFLIYQKAFCD